MTDTLSMVLSASARIYAIVNIKTAPPILVRPQPFEPEGGFANGGNELVVACFRQDQIFFRLESTFEGRNFFFTAFQGPGEHGTNDQQSASSSE